MPDLESLEAKVDKLIRGVDILDKRVEGFDDRIARIEDVEKRLQVTAERMAGSMLKISVARFAPIPVLALVALLAGLVGGMAGAVVQNARAPHAQAAGR